MLTDILCYQAAGNYVEYRRAVEDAATRSESWSPATDWWSHIVPVPIGAQGILSQLVLYNLESGTLQIATIEATQDGGSLTVFAPSQVGWRPGWTHVTLLTSTPGKNLLLFYDSSQGAGSIYSLNGVAVNLMNSFTILAGCQIVVPGDFGGDSGTGLLFYNPAVATGIFYTVDAGSLNPTALTTDTKWRGSWHNIVPGKFGGNGSSDLVFYDADSGTGAFYSVHQGVLTLLSEKNIWKRTWNNILPGNFSGGSTTDLFFYDPYSGTAEFYSTAQGQLSVSLGYFTDWRNSWNTVAAGAFTGNFVPNVIGQQRLQAQNTATAAGVAYYFTGSNLEAALVKAQKPPAGQIVNAGDALLMTMG